MELKMTILYGSETGTAQDTAEQIWKSAKRNGIKCFVTAMDDYEIAKLTEERLVIFVVATTGQGDPPKNMTKFWRLLLRKTLPAKCLENVKYAVLGLGDSSYKKYNFAAKKLNRRLAQLGAKEIQAIGLADDQHDLGIDAVVDPWTQNLWRIISKEFNVKLDYSEHSDHEIIERFEVNIVQEEIDNLEQNRDIFRLEVELNKELRIGKILENIRTTSEDHFQDVRLIKFHCNNVNYSPGDILYVKPRNSPKQVANFFNLLMHHGIALGPETLISVKEKEIKVPAALKQILTLKEIVEQYWDLSFKPRRSTMQVLASISEDELEKEKLHEFTLPAGQEELFSYVNRPRRNILEVLGDFPHTARKLSLKILFEIMSPIKPRAFSIASSCEENRNEIHLLVAVVKYKTKLVEPRLGLCSNWLATLKPGEEIIFSIQKGTFKFTYGKPMILIGPGTGVAPFRSLLLQQSHLNANLADTVLFFGCRNKHKDYHCRKDFESIRKNNDLRVFCAFSRDQEEKIYVQHVIQKERQLCWELLERGGSIYLSGSSKNMPKCVRDEFVAVARDLGKLTETEAEKFIEKLEKDGRYQEETWG
ncbi:NADPH-dependent diflavin oxidoreductase 1 [Venturia canescens]|uniref:NADPH-dependent diflavin oxidoreductase 1 n=1 Tax=Venturia canescens TaxID=32260 RepID=UPI001C9BC15A|nr:NADPH-dependent diflavin oxidoreductase 1 [Venturia canescens]